MTIPVSFVQNIKQRAAVKRKTLMRVKVFIAGNDMSDFTCNGTYQPNPVRGGLADGDVPAVLIQRGGAGIVPAIANQSPRGAACRRRAGVSSLNTKLPAGFGQRAFLRVM